MVDVASLWNLSSGEEKRLCFDSSAINFRSIADANSLIRRNLHRLSGRYDIVVGVPRSGLLFANIIALNLNLRLTTVDGFLSGDADVTYIGRGQFAPAKGKRVLIVDDTINTGSAIEKVRAKTASVVSERGYDVEYLAVYGTKLASASVNICLEVLDQPRVFEWNFLHHTITSNFLFDLDGVICEDGPAESTDNPERYVKHLTSARPKFLPSFPIGAIVTSRLAKYRRHTEEWLDRHGVRYRYLIMVNLPTAEERRRLAIHAAFKADVYKTLGGQIFIESETWQADKIAEITKKHVYDLARGTMI